MSDRARCLQFSKTVGHDDEFDALWDGSESVIQVEIAGNYTMRTQAMKVSWRFRGP